MKRKDVLPRQEEGFILVTAMLILLMLSILGIAATNNSRLDVDIAANDKFHKVAFYVADSGIFTAPKVISEAIRTDADPVIHNAATPIILYGQAPDEAGRANPPNAVTKTDFFNEIMGFTGFQDADLDPLDLGIPPAADIQFSVGDDLATVDIVHAGSKPLAGGSGAEFGSSSMGIGSGATGGVEIHYDLNSFGTGPTNAEVQVLARYRKVPGTAGGL